LTGRRLPRPVSELASGRVVSEDAETLVADEPGLHSVFRFRRNDQSLAWTLWRRLAAGRMASGHVEEGAIVTHGRNQTIGQLVFLNARHIEKVTMTDPIARLSVDATVFDVRDRAGS
jgi:hypothetical protein